MAKTAKFFGINPRFTFQRQKEILNWLVMFCLVFFPFFFFPRGMINSNILYHTIFNAFIIVLIYLLNIYLLIPIFLREKRIFAYFIGFLFCIIMTGSLNFFLFGFFVQPLALPDTLQYITAPLPEIKLINPEITTKLQAIPPLFFSDTILYLPKGHAPFGKDFMGISALPDTIQFVSSDSLNRAIGKILFKVPNDILMFHEGMDLRVAIMRALPVIFVFAISTCIEITGEWMLQENKRKEIEKEKLKSELSFLKSQVNPHFLFNTLNNIYSLAANKSDKTEEAILKLSNLMRYMLYESNVEKISMEREVEHLENYIALQKLRVSAKKNILIQFKVEGNVQDKMIEPMLFIPFVENAFKHGLSYIKNSFIDVLLKVEEKVVFLSVANLKMPKATELPDEDTGIGLKNVQRRLDLLYKNNYELKIWNETELYKVELLLKLYEN